MAYTDFANEKRRHVHFDEYEMTEDRDEGGGHQEEEKWEVSCEQNPTRLFLLMNRQLWDSALSHLHYNRVEARTWISSICSKSNEYKWRNLPLHLACLHGPEPVPLQFMEGLIDAYTDAARHRNHEGNLPIHLACETMDFNPRFGLEVEGILILLINAYPECLGEKDAKGRRPIDILKERGISALDDKKRRSGSGVGIIKYMKAQARVVVVEEEHRQERDEYEVSNNEAKPRIRPRSIEVPSSRETPVPWWNEEMMMEEWDGHSNSTSLGHMSDRDDLSDDQCDDDNIEPPVRPSNIAVPIVTPHNANVVPMTSDGVCQLRSMGAELTSPMSKLEDRIRKLEVAHLRTVTELEEKTKAIEGVKHKEKAMSSELAIKLKVERSHIDEIKRLKDEVEKEREDKAAVTEKLDNHMKLCTHSKAASKESEQLRKKNKELQSHLQKSKIKEKTLLGLLSKMHSVDLDESKELQRQLAEMKAVMKAKDSKAKSEKNKLLKKNKEMQVRIKQLQAYDKIHSEVETLHAKNKALREVALQAVETVGVLQRRRNHQAPSSEGCSQESLKQLLTDAESVSVVAGDDSSQKGSILDAGKSLHLLRPVIGDARSIQQETVEHMQQLLQHTHDTISITEQISSIPENEFRFEPTLQVLEDTITSHVHILENLAVAFEAKDQCKSKLKSLLSPQQLLDINSNFISAKQREVSDDAQAVAISSATDQSTRMVSISLEHVEVLESLSEIVESLPSVKRLDLDSNREGVQKHLNVVDELTTGLQRALSNLLKDAKKF